MCKFICGNCYENTHARSDTECLCTSIYAIYTCVCVCANSLIIIIIIIIIILKLLSYRYRHRPRTHSYEWSCSPHNCGCMVDGGNTRAAI